MIARALELKPASQNIELKDVKGQWYQNEAQALYEAGIIKGFGEDTFGGGKKLNSSTSGSNAWSHVRIRRC